MSMGLEATVDALRRELARLQEAVSSLLVTVTEDKPAHGAAVLVDRLDNLVTDLSSTLEEADVRAAQALHGSQLNGPLENVRAAMRDIHELLNRFTAVYAGELATHDRIAQLLEMGGERGREWREWSEVVKTAIERCATPMLAVAGAMLDCWSELAERLARNSVSVQATNIGQQITMREDQFELADKAT
jgi:hypothetical protein